MDPLLHWLAIAATVALVGGYELRLALLARRSPAATARSAHALLRGEWVEALSSQPGSEIVAVQTLRNSLMSATISASTAALALMGTITLAAQGAAASPLHPFAPRGAAELLLVATLFASYVCSAMAMRYFNHAGFALSLPVRSEQRERRLPLAVGYVKRAGVLYSWGLRCFLFAAPIVAGLLSPPAMPLAALALLFVLRAFDRAPGVADDGHG